ncbi:MAG: hypothetical protein D3910_25350 [Candidatus Electrothrix sp. ATG2]|nr:hypothetical protein [Candidatus Electrothrix sp. ATG2]
MAFREVFGEARPTLPLQDGGNIVCGNATRMDWEEVCPKEEGAEIYILGNPPYLGYGMQAKEQKADLAEVFRGIKRYKNLDYISCWFMLGSRYIHNSTAQLAFVSTNSISQGEQVAILWPHIFSFNVEIDFAYQSFKWINNARGNAGVTCVVIGIRNQSEAIKLLYNDGVRHVAKNINPYLTNSGNSFVSKRTNPISTIPLMLRGSGAVDGGNLLLSPNERESLLTSCPEVSIFIKKIIGAYEFLNGYLKYCLWITDNHLEKALTIPEIADRIDKVKKSRLASRKKATQEKAKMPHQFGEIRFKGKTSLFIPSVSSERREYIPFGFQDSDDVIIAPNLAIYDPPPYIFAVISSRTFQTCPLGR